MSDDLLPDNLDEWPSDPREWFHVKRSFDERTLRKAYHRLIRRFKPEHYPEQFRRILEAYESLKWQAVSSDRDDPQFDVQEGETSAEEDWPVSGGSWRETGGAADPPTMPADPQAAWSAALSGEYADASERLLQSAQRFPDDEETVLRACWLAKLADEPDSDAVFGMLEQHLQRVGLAGRAFHLYLMELDRQRRHALTDAARHLLVQSAHDPRLPDLTRLTWIACAALGYRERLIEDLDALKPTVSFDAPDTWRRLLFQAAEILVLRGATRDAEGYQWIEAELRAAGPRPEEDWYADRWEMVAALAFESDGIVIGVPQSICRFARESLLGDDWELRRTFQDLVAPWRQRIDFVLQDLTDTMSSSPVAVYLLQRYAEQARDDHHLFYDDDYVQNLKPRIWEFARLKGGEGYRTLRREVLDFCLREDVSVDAVLHYSLGPEAESVALELLTDENVSLLNGDQPLKCLVACLRVFNE